jgi:hypothetical protein
VARSQPGWWLDLEGPFALARPLTLADLRASGSEVRAALDALSAEHAGSLYFPFFFYGGEELRPMQPYLNKLPAAVVTLFPTLAPQIGPLRAERHELQPEQRLGSPYRAARVSVLPDRREPFSVDPAVVERGLRGHADTQNAVADALRGAGFEPLSPRGSDPNFDIAWARGDVVYVAEVKSITDSNEEQQLRLGLGQVLRYRHLLRGRYPEVQALLIPERPPSDPTWPALCAELGVKLVTPESFGELL